MYEKNNDEKLKTENLRSTRNNQETVESVLIMSCLRL